MRNIVHLLFLVNTALGGRVETMKETLTAFERLTRTDQAQWSASGAKVVPLNSLCLRARRGESGRVSLGPALQCGGCRPTIGDVAPIDSKTNKIAIEKLQLNVSNTAARTASPRYLITRMSFATRLTFIAGSSLARLNFVTSLLPEHRAKPMVLAYKALRSD